MDEPPSKDSVDIGSANLPVNDIKGKSRVGKWDFLTKPILYPAGGSLSFRCGSIFMDIQG